MSKTSLAAVRKAFASWREGKSHRDSVPERLWVQAAEAARVHGRTKAARALGVNHSRLKRYMESLEPASPAEFVELPLGSLLGGSASVEVEDADGTRLRLSLPGARPADVAAAARELWAARR